MLQVSLGKPRAVVAALDARRRASAAVLFHSETRTHTENYSRDLTIRLAQTAAERDNARDVVNRMYQRRGYGDDHDIADRAGCATFIAATGSETLGTLTLTIDSPARLAADSTFPEELDALRAQPGRSLCELTKFAFDPSPESRPLLAKLFHVIYIYGMHHYACTDLLIEVNPRHVRFYEVMLGFKRMGPVRTNGSVAAPSQLMHLPVADITRNIDLLRKQECFSGHSLYPLFMGTRDEQTVRRNLQALARPHALNWGKPSGRRHRERERIARRLLPLLRRRELFRRAEIKSPAPA